MKLVVLLMTLQTVFSFTVQINNIHNGYRNVYKGTAALEQGTLSVSQYEIVKKQLTPEETPFLNQEESKISLLLDDFVRQYYQEDIDPSAPRLVYRYFEEPKIVLTVFSESENELQLGYLSSMISLGKDMSDLDM